MGKIGNWDFMCNMEVICNRDCICYFGNTRVPLVYMCDLVIIGNLDF